MVQLAAKLLVSKPFGEGGGGLGIDDVGDRVSCLREAPDEVTQRFPRGLMKLFQVILGARLLACSHVVVGEDFLEVVPRSNGVLLQAKEPIICSLVNHDRKVVCHDVLISAHGFYSDLV